MQSLANQIKVYKIHAVIKFMIELVDRCRAYTCFACKVSLRPPKLAKLSGE